MKKLLSYSAFILSSFYASSQGCSNVFISEVVEGWSNNKAVEIYNPTANPIDVSEYGLVRFANGSTDYGEIAYLDGLVIQPYDVLVVVLEKLDSLGEELEAPVWDELQEVADVFMNPNYDDGIWPMYFNGDDAIALVTDDGETLVDLFGRIGEGTEFGGWGPYLDNEGVQSYMSRDHTLIRKPEVEDGQTTNPTEFDILAQWDSLPANTFEFLGAHNCQCALNRVDENQNFSSVRIFPNPMNGDAASVISSKKMTEINVFSELGSLLERFTNINDIMYRLDISSGYKGAMLVEIHFADGTVARQRLVN